MGSNILSWRSSHRTLETPFPPNNQEKGKQLTGMGILGGRAAEVTQALEKKTKQTLVPKVLSLVCWCPFLAGMNPSLHLQENCVNTINIPFAVSPQPQELLPGFREFCFCRSHTSKVRAHRKRHEQCLPELPTCSCSSHSSISLPFPNVCLWASNSNIRHRAHCGPEASLLSPTMAAQLAVTNPWKHTPHPPILEVLLLPSGSSLYF